MNIIFDKSFSKSLNKITDQDTKDRIAEVILEVEAANTINKVGNIKKMQGFKTFYRIRVGDYRIGVELEDLDIRFIIVVHRKDIYKKFP